MATGGSLRPGYVAFVLNCKGNNFRVRLDADKSPHLGVRGVDKEKEYFKNVFVDKLGLEWINKPSDTKFENLTVADWNHSANKQIEDGHLCPDDKHRCLRCNILSRDYSSSRYFVLVVSTHGFEEQESKFQMIGDPAQRRDRSTENDYVLMSEIMAVLGDKQLANVTKILILQACRMDPLHTWMNEGNSGEGNSAAAANTESPADGKDLPRNYSPSTNQEAFQELPLRLQEPPLDFLIVFSTTKGRWTYNTHKDGSWMLNCMNETMSKVHESMPNSRLKFMTFLTKSNKLVCEQEFKKFKRDCRGKVIVKEGNPVVDETANYKSTLCILHRLREVPVFELKK